MDGADPSVASRVDPKQERGLGNGTGVAARATQIH